MICKTTRPTSIFWENDYISWEVDKNEATENDAAKTWLGISQSIIRAVESNYMQNDRADLNFQGK